VIARFRSYNLQHAEVLADIVDIAPLTVAKVHAIVRRMDGITRDFTELFASRSDEGAAASAFYDGLKGPRAAGDEGATPGRPLPLEVTRLVQMFEDRPRSRRSRHCTA